MYLWKIPSVNTIIYVFVSLVFRGGVKEMEAKKCNTVVSKLSKKRTVHAMSSEKGTCRTN